MAEIFSFSDFKKQIKKDEDKNFQELLLKANSLKKISKNKTDIENFQKLKKAFEIQLNTFFLESRLVGSDFLLCASYIASILSVFGNDIPESWYMTDYLLKDQEKGGDGQALKEGADVCFILCSLFPERCNRRSMKKDDYVAMGSSMYYTYYSRTGKEVVYHMSRKFEVLSQATAECVQKV